MKIQVTAAITVDFEAEDPAQAEALAVQLVKEALKDFAGEADCISLRSKVLNQASPKPSDFISEAAFVTIENSYGKIALSAREFQNLVVGDLNALLQQERETGIPLIAGATVDGRF